MKIYLEKSQIRKMCYHSTILLDKDEAYVRFDDELYRPIDFFKRGKCFPFFADNGIIVTYSKRAIRLIKETLESRALIIRIAYPGETLHGLENPNHHQTESAIQYMAKALQDHEERIASINRSIGNPESNVNIPIKTVSLSEAVQTATESASKIKSQPAQDTEPVILSNVDKENAKAYLGNLIGPSYIKNGVKFVKTERWGDIPIKDLNLRIRKQSFDDYARDIFEIYEACEGPHDEELSRLYNLCMSIVSDLCERFAIHPAVFKDLVNSTTAYPEDVYLPIDELESYLDKYPRDYSK